MLISAIVVLSSSERGTPGLDVHTQTSELVSSDSDFAPASELPAMDCTRGGRDKSNPYFITVTNNGADKFKISTCNRDVCSSGTHKYFRCHYIEPGSTVE